MINWRHFRFGSTAGPKWVCGHAAMGRPCRVGPDGRGRCQATFECAPIRKGDQWFCRRSPSQGGLCQEGPHENGRCSHAVPPCRPVRSARAMRRAASAWTVIFTVGLLALALTYAGDAEILLPGPMARGHATIGECSACHSGLEQGRFGWLHALFSQPTEHDQSKGCLSCHQVAAEAFTPHGQPLDRLEAMTQRTRERALDHTPPLAKHVRSAFFPAREAFRDGIFCATCHKEHHGETVDLTHLDSDRCHTCHAMQFASFESGHPELTDFPYSRRTRINFDHNSHFGEHFPKTRAKEDPAQPVQDTCADCHVLAVDGRHMDVKPFAQVCSACHLHQITGAERLSSLQGIKFLTLPGLDLRTLEEQNASPGEWPRESGALPSPLMAMLLATDATRALLVEMVSNLDLQDLSGASAREIRAVRWYAWETKALLYKLASEKPAEVFAALARTADGKPDTDALARLTAHIPRDVIAGAIRDWLPNLAKEMAQYTPIDPAGIAILNLSADPAAEIKLAANDEETEEELSADDEELPEEEELGDDEEAGSDILSDDEIESIETGEDDTETQEDTAEQDEEKAEEDTASQDEEKAEEDTTSQDNAEEPEPEQPAGVDAQTWAEQGGWYRQEFSVLYKPTGHADGFFRAWLDMTANAFSDEGTPVAARLAFEALIDDGAQGQCTKCHSIDRTANGHRKINWKPAARDPGPGIFTRFAHEPHFAFPGDKGCMSCHQLHDTSPFQKGFEDHDPNTFASNFKAMRREQCGECHKTSGASTECLTCHTYHVDGVVTPAMTTRVPR